MKRTFILASQSPRRIAFMNGLNLRFRSRPVSIDERVYPGERASIYLRRITHKKLSAARSRFGDKNPIVAADTIVVLKNQIIGKPRSRFDAIQMLKKLSGKRHVVWTMICFFDPQQHESRCVTVKTRVQFTPISKAMLSAYIQSGEWKDKAGAYAVQGLGSLFIENIAGSLSNVIGFPLREFFVEADKLGIL